MQLVSNVFPIWWEEKRGQLSDSILSVWGLTNQRFPPVAALVTEDELFPELAHLVVDFVQKNALSVDDEFATLDFVLAGAFETKGFRNRVSQVSPYKGLERITAAMLHENLLRDDAPPLHFALEKIHPSSILILKGIQDIARNQFHKRIMQGRFTHNDRMLFLYHMLVAYHDLSENSFFKTGTKPHPVHSYKELIVDEYQDTNELQHKILASLISPDMGRMVVVGDPKQSIYGFRSAHVGVFQQLKTDSKWKLIELTCNFRSHPDLLPWINYLSELSFAFRNNKIPEEFLGTTFSLSAQRTFVASKSLDAGRARESQEDEPKHPRVLLLGASLSKDRCTSTMPESLPTQHSFACHALARELQELTSNHGYQWKDFVILCETNEWVNKTHQQLKQYGIPTVAKTSRPSEKSSLSQNRCEELGFLLAKWLCCPLQLAEFSNLIWSGFFELSPTEASAFISAASNGELGFLYVEQAPTVQNSEHTPPMRAPEAWRNIKEHINKCRELAGKHFFSGWQVFRWSWQGANTKTLKTMNLDMENSAFALQHVLQIWTIRASLEAGAAQLAALAHLSQIHAGPTLDDRANDFGQKLHHLQPGFWPHELLEHQLKQLRLKELATDPNLNAITICTIHGAKGLEWPIVVFWPGTKSERAAEHFVMKSGENATHIKWLAEDTESASLLPWINNPNPPDDVVSVQVETAGGEQAVRWSADLQDRLEQDYERQRVFYTAYTRAREMLILLSPSVSGRTQKNLRDKLAILKKSDAFDTTRLKISGLEASVWALFADTFFDLRKEDKRGSKPQLPWQGDIIEAKLQNNDWQQVLALRDYGPDWLSILATSVPKAQQQISDDESATIQPALSDQWRELWAIQQEQKALVSPWAIANASDSSVAQELLRVQNALNKNTEFASNLEEKDSIPALSASESGLRFHALMEHSDTIQRGKKTFLDKLRSNASVLEHELELWGAFDVPQSEDDTANELQKTRRKIIDLFCVLPASKWPQYLWDSPCVHDELKVTTNFRNVIERHIANDPNVHLIIDFKTGQPSLEHLTQMQTYLSWVRLILQRHPQLLVKSSTQETLFTGSDKPLIGILFYTSANFSAHTSDFAPCFVEVDKTTSLLFVSPE